MSVTLRSLYSLTLPRIITAALNVASLLLLANTGLAAEKSGSESEAAQLVRVTMFPKEAVLSGARSKQGFRVTGEFADGKLRDLTDQCEFRSSAPNVAEIKEGHVAQPKTNGRTTITAKFESHEVTASLSISQVEDSAYNFRNDVLPVIEHLTCNQMGCHGSPKGKKRLQLSLFSADPHKDFLQITDKSKKLIDPADAANSWLLLKATCQEDHGGSDLTEEGSAEYNVLLDWIKNGAPEGRSADPEIVRVEVYPVERRLIPGEKHRLLVEAHYSNGTMRDVTELASFKSDEEAVAKVAATGIVEGTGYGEAVVMVSYSGRLTTSRVISSQPATVPFPNVPTHGKVDELVLAKQRSLNIIPSELCTDSDFLRRAHLDVIGVLPTVEETRAFLADKNPNKRKLLVDALLDRPEYADFYALKWGDVLQINRAEPAQLQEKGMWAFHRWLWEALDQNLPMDRFVKEILTARGSGYRNGPANFFRVGEGPQGMAEHASTAFLGVRLDCAHCHNHPFEQFTLNDNLGMAAFFTKVKIKRSQEDDEEIIYLAETGSIKNPDTNQIAAAKFLGGEEVAANERAASVAADLAKTEAENFVKQMATAVKQALDKSAADKTAGEKRLAEKSQAAAKAMQIAKDARAAADQAAQELASLEKDALTKTDAEKEKSEKLIAEKSAAMKTAIAKADSAQAAADKSNVEKIAAEKSLLEQTSANKKAVAATAAAKQAADKTLSEKTELAKLAAAAITAKENEGDPRARLADWITSPDNPYFARHMANRVWTWLLGRGIIDEPDDFRSTNPASNPELLDYLASEFIQSRYDMKALFRLVLNSRTYQLSAQPNAWNKHDRIQYSHANLKRLTAEQLATAISQVTGVHEKYPGLPLGTRAIQLPDVSMRSEFLDLFGRPKRATPVESERTCDTHLGQSLQMISSDYVSRKLVDNSGRVALLAASTKADSEVVDDLYLATLSRFPTDAERQLVLAEPIDKTKRRQTFEDLLWVLMNTKEFLFNH